MATHLTGLGDEVVGEVAIDDPVDGVEGENLAGDESTLDLINEVVVPVEQFGLAHAGLVRGLSSVHLPVLDHQPDNAEGIGDDGSLRRSNNVDLATEDEDEQSDEEDAETEQVSGPEVDVTLHVGGSEQRQRSGVDAPVEDLFPLVKCQISHDLRKTYHVNPLDGNRRVNDDLLASFVIMANDHLSPLVLIGNQRRNVGLDATSSETNDDNGNDETT